MSALRRDIRVRDAKGTGLVKFMNTWSAFGKGSMTSFVLTASNVC